MNSLIPNRKQATPLMSFYAEGKYDKNLINFMSQRRNMAVSGTSAKYAERNSRPYDEINVKPSVHDRFSSKFYQPGKYLNPLASKNSSFPVPKNVEFVERQQKDIQRNATGKAFIQKPKQRLKTKISQSKFVTSANNTTVVSKSDLMKDMDNQLNKTFGSPRECYKDGP